MKIQLISIKERRPINKEDILKVGQRVVCIKDFYMIHGPLALKKGNTYTVNCSSSIIEGKKCFSVARDEQNTIHWFEYGNCSYLLKTEENAKDKSKIKTSSSRKNSS